MFGKSSRLHAYDDPLNKSKGGFQNIILAGLALLATYIITSYQAGSFDSFFSSDAITEEAPDDGLHGLEPGKYHGTYPHSLLTLFYPYTLLRDVVLDQPISDTDIPFFWHLHNTDEIAVKRILRDCYGLEIIELNDKESIDKARELNIVKDLNRTKHVITSPFIRETSEIFTTDNFGRMICFTRHPLDYDLHPDLPTFEAKDNWLTRLLSNWHTEELTFKELGVAKHVIRQCCLMGNQDRMKSSLIRIGEHMNWPFANGMTIQEGNKCMDDALIGFPTQKWRDHATRDWQNFYKDTKYDCQLYELSRSVWRSQIQTIIPYELQLSRDEDDDEEEDEEE